MAHKTGCHAKQQSDQMHCPRCHLLWDMNDPDPPQCKRLEKATTRKRGSSLPDDTTNSGTNTNQEHENV